MMVIEYSVSGGCGSKKLYHHDIPLEVPLRRIHDRSKSRNAEVDIAVSQVLFYFTTSITDWPTEIMYADFGRYTKAGTHSRLRKWANLDTASTLLLVSNNSFFIQFEF